MQFVAFLIQLLEFWHTFLIDNDIMPDLCKGWILRPLGATLQAIIHALPC